MSAVSATTAKRNRMPDRQLEAFHLERFLTAMDIPSEEAREHSEAPDFLLALDGRTIGIEHTQFFLPPDPGGIAQQQLEALQDLAVEQARRTFRKAGGPALYVYPLFNDRRALRSKKQAYALGERIAALVARNGWPRNREARTFETWREIPELHGYTVMASVDGVDELWSGGSGGLVATVEPHHVQSCLHSKAERYVHYVGQAEEVWLLIVNDMFRGGAPCEFGEEAAAAQYVFPFDRAFWLEIGSNHVTELVRR